MNQINNTPSITRIIEPYINNIDIHNRVLIDYSTIKPKELFNTALNTFEEIAQVLDSVLSLDKDPLFRYKLYTERILRLFYKNYSNVSAVNYLKTRLKVLLSNEEISELIKYELILSSKQHQIIDNCKELNYFKPLDSKMISTLMRTIYLESTLNSNPLYTFSALDFLHQNIFAGEAILNKYNSIDVKEYL